MYRKDDRYRRQLEHLIFDTSIFSSEIFDNNAIKETWREYLGGNIRLHFEVEALKSFASLQKLIPSIQIEL
jgi:hypothetical protein